MIIIVEMIALLVSVMITDDNCDIYMTPIMIIIIIVINVKKYSNKEITKII